MSDSDDVQEPRNKRARAERLVDDIADDEDDPDADDDDYDVNTPEDDEDRQFVAKDEETGSRKRDRPSDRKRVMSKSRYDDSDDEGALHMSIDQRREEAEDQRILASLENRYGEGADEEIDLNEMGEYDEEEGYEEGGAGVILPSIKDPKLWLIKCDPGTEDISVLQLMQKFIENENSRDEALFIYSAFTTPASKGYVYVEADKEVHVKRAIRGIKSLKWWKIQLLPINQMVNAVKFHDEIPVIVKGQWVRMKTGLYRGDLGKVVGLYDQNTMLTVKLVPRIDMQALGDARKRKRAPISYTAQNRPGKALFNRNEVQERGGSVSFISKHPRDGRRYDQLGSSRFRHGFLYKDVRFTGVITENVQPTSLEAEEFLRRVKGDSGDDESDEEPAEVQINTGPKDPSSLLAIGDHVIVAEGDLKNITGRIVSLDKHKLTLQPDANQPLSMNMDFMPKQVKKFFRIGDHVKVIAGVYKDETGMVIQVQPQTDTLSIYSDTQQRELSVETAHVIESSEVSTGRESLGAFSLYDLVQMKDNQVGVIVKIDVASFRVLTQRGVVETVKLQEIGSKRHSKFAAALDAHGNQLSKDDVVVVQQGEHKGKQGTIKHIFRHFLFCFSQKYASENSGLFVVQARQAALVGTHANFSIGARTSLVAASPHIGPGGSTQQNNGMGAPAARPARAARFGDCHPLVGKTVSITGGPYKSFMGVVQEVTDQNVRVELHALARKVMVSLSQVAERGVRPVGDAGSLRAQEERDFFQGSQTPLLGSRTPAHDFGSATPAHEGFGSQTPAHSSFGSQTPSRDAWSAQTPARSMRDDNSDEEDDDVWKNNASTPSSHAHVDEDEEHEDQNAAEAAEPEEVEEALLPLGAKVWYTDEAGNKATSTMIEHTEDGGCRLYMDSTKEKISVPRSARSRMAPVVPEKNDTFIMISGEQHLGDTGTLGGISPQTLEAIIYIKGEVGISHLHCLCKYDKDWTKKQ